MSLAVWLPLNGDLHNQGLLPVTITEYGDMTISNSGKIGKCYTFDGNDDYLSLAGLNFSGLSEFSFSFWCKPLKNSLLGIFQIKSGGTVALQFATATSFTFRDSEHSSLTGVSFNTPVAGEWAHYAFIYNKGSWSVYKNGIQDGSGFTATQEATFYQSSTTVFIGCRRTSSVDRYFSGDLNDFRIYDHALSPKEVEEIAKGLVLHYKLDNNGMGGDNLALNTRKLDIASSKNNLYMYRRGYPTIQLRNDGFSELKCTASWQGLSFWANQLNLSPGTKVTYSFYIYGNGSSRNLSFYPIMYDSAGTRDTSTGLPISVDGGTYTTANAKAFTNTTATSPEYHYVTFEWNQAVANIIANGGSIELSIQVHGTWNSGDWACIFSPKVEIGDKPTAWSPAKSELGDMATTVYDCSGYCNNGEIVGNITTITPSPRYNCATKLNSTKIDQGSTRSGAAYIVGDISLTEPSQISISWWINGQESYNSSTGQFNNGVWSTSMTDASDYSASAFNHRDNTFDINSSDGVKKRLTANILTNNQWNYYALVYDGQIATLYKNGNIKQTISFDEPKTLGSFIKIFIGFSKAGGAYRKVIATYSDFRIYCTALSANQVKELYNTSMQIDSSGNVFARELVEL